MSYYLVERIKAQPNIEGLTRSEVTALEGCDGNLETARWRHGRNWRLPSVLTKHGTH
jgi:thioredoxin reductase (NADPH)